MVAEAAVAEDGALGQDPRKRRQIMDGARAVFMEKGFDAASMNDIARRAGVSKGTLYVYFENKERLFVELISTEKREELFSVIQLDHDNHDVRAVLTDCGTRLVEILTRPYYVQAMRTVMSIVNRMPEIGQEFYGRGPALCADQIAAYLASQVKAGAEPVRQFMARNTRPEQRTFFVDTTYRLWGKELAKDVKPNDFIILMPAFLVSQINAAFEVGFLLYLPFVIIDLVVSNILLAMGMMMVSPVMISLPLKLFLFIMLDGWTRLIQGLVLSYV